MDDSTRSAGPPGTRAGGHWHTLALAPEGGLRVAHRCDRHLPSLDPGGPPMAGGPGPAWWAEPACPGPCDDCSAAGAAPPGCDFCTAPGATWREPAGPIELRLAGGYGFASPDDWAACDACHVLIERGDREALAARCADQLAAAGELPAAALAGARAAARWLHDAFFAARRGAARRVGG
jgi:hypothetical protein